MVDTDGDGSPWPPSIRQVHIRNYKSVGAATVELGPLTILVGANGAGKSNFIDALSFVRDSWPTRSSSPSRTAAASPPPAVVRAATPRTSASAS